MPRFVLLEHSLPPGRPRGLHWDFMLELGQTLRTWALPSVPAPGEPMECDSLADHRADYLDYEGPVSGDRGSVRRIDAGVFELLADTPAGLQIALHGAVLQGLVRLTPLATQDQRWSFEFVAG